MKLEGFDKLEKQLKRIEDEIKKAVDGEVPFSELFNSHFMSVYAKHRDIESFFEDSPFDIETEEDFKNIDIVELNQYVAENTRFQSWSEMEQQAAEEYAARKLKTRFN